MDLKESSQYSFLPYLSPSKEESHDLVDDRRVEETELDSFIRIATFSVIWKPVHLLLLLGRGGNRKL